MQPRWQVLEIDENAIPTTDDDPELWGRIRRETHIGDFVTGTVICRRQFGVFVDIGYGPGAAALLLVPEFTDAHLRPIAYDEYPHVGDSVSAQVLFINPEDCKISLTQNQLFDSQTGTFTRP